MESRPLRIAHVIARMNVGGPAILITELIKGANGEDFQSFLITGYCEKNEVDYLQANEINLNETRIKGLGRSVSIFADLKALLLVISTLRKIKPDIVHTHTAKAGVIGRITALLAVPKAKRVHTFHGHLLHGYFSPTKTKLVIWIERLLAFITDAILTVGNQVKVDLLASKIGTSSKMFVTFPGLSVRSDSNRDNLRKNLSIPADEIVLIYVGRLTKIKRPDRLVNSFNLAAKLNNKIRLLIIGDGELRNDLKKLAGDLKVNFLGWRTDVYDLMNASDIAILTSDNEGMPITLIEAAHLGLPSISTEVGSVADVIINGKTGYLTPLDDSEIAQRITQLASSVELRNEFGKAAKEYAKNNFSVDAMIDFHKSLYKSLLN